MVFSHLWQSEIFTSLEVICSSYASKVFHKSSISLFLLMQLNAWLICSIVRYTDMFLGCLWWWYTWFYWRCMLPEFYRERERERERDQSNWFQVQWWTFCFIWLLKRFQNFICYLSWYIISLCHGVVYFCYLFVYVFESLFYKLNWEMFHSTKYP